MIHALAVSAKVNMATGNQFNLYATYYERFLALSVSIRVCKLHQLKLETTRLQAPVLRYRNITFTSDDIKNSLSAVCPLLKVHNVARVRAVGSLLLIEVDFTEVTALASFCKSLSSGEVQKRLRDQLIKLKATLYSSERDIDVILKLHLVMPNAEKKSVASREVTTDNYEDSFTRIKESALFEFQSLNIAHHDAISEEDTQPDLIGIDDLHELFKDLLEVMADWFSVGVLLKIRYYTLQAIKKDYHESKDCLREMLATWLIGGNASTAQLVQALRSDGYGVLANKMAVKHGVTVPRIAETEDTHLPSTVPTEDLVLIIGEQAHQLCSPTLAEIRQGIATKDTECSSFSDKLDKLKKKESKVMESLKQTKSSLESAKVKIDELKCEQHSLIEKREIKQSSRKWLIWQKSYTFGEDLIKLNQKIKDVEEAVDELSQKIDKLEKTIMTHNEQAKQFKNEQLMREKERKDLKMKIDGIQKEKENLDCKLKKDRLKFENEMQRMINELKLSETKVESMKDELFHRREVELVQAIEKSRAVIAPPSLDEHVNMELKQDELSHRREVELPQASLETLVAPPLLDEHVYMESMKDELFHRREVELARAVAKSRAAVIAPPSLDDHVNMEDELSNRREVELPQASSETLIAHPLLDEHAYKHDGYLWIKRVPSGKKLLRLFSSTKWVSVFAVLDDSCMQFYQDHKMAEQPTADSKPANDSFHLLHAKISEVNTKGKKINHIIKLSSPTEKELHLGVDALSTMKEWSSAIQTVINHIDHLHLTPDKSAVMLMDASLPANNVKSKYKGFLKQYYDQDPLPHDDKLFVSNPNKRGYAELDISEKNKETTLEMEKKNDESLSSIKGISQSIIALNDILIPDKEGKPVQLVLIEGTSGIGKTTLAWQLCHKWAKGQLDSLKDYDLVVLVRLRKKRAQKATKLEDLLLHDNRTNMEDLIAAMGNGERVLILCDGFDELPHHQQRSDFYVHLFSGELLPAATVIVTTRPSASYVFKRFINQNINRELEITGFTRKGIMEFAKSIFSNMAVFDDFVTYIQSNPPFNSMMYLPLSAVVIAKIYQESYKTNTPFPNTMSELFDAFACVLVRRHLESIDQTITMPSSLQDIRKLPLVASQLFKIVEVAYDGMCNNLYVFNELPEDFEHLELMRKITRDTIAHGRRATFVFFHYTLQEYLAALHIANHLSCQLDSLQLQLEHRYTYMVTRFLAGICRNNRHDYCSNLCQWLVHFLHQICFDRSRALQLVHCAYECPSIVNDLKVEYSENNAFIVVEPEEGIDWYAMGYCISHFDERWGLHATHLRKENIDLLEKGLMSRSPPKGTLNYLHISKSDVAVSQVLASLGEFCQLECLELLYISIDEEDEEALKKLNLKKLTISCELVQPLAALLHNTSLTHLVIDSQVYNSDLRFLTGLVESHSTLQVLKLGKIVHYSLIPNPTYTSSASTSRNLHQLVTVAINSQLKMLKLHQEDYNYIPEYHNNPTLSVCM